MATFSREDLKQAIFGQESNHGKADTSQENYAGARGPMQVQRKTFEGLQKQGLIPKEWTHDNPEHTKQAGFKLIDVLADKFGDDPRKVAAAYYGGEKAVAADGTIRNFGDLKNPKAPTTVQYADQIMARLGNPASTSSVSKATVPTVARADVNASWDVGMPDRAARTRMPVTAKAADEPIPESQALPPSDGSGQAAALEAVQAGEQKVNQLAEDTPFVDKYRAASLQNTFVGAAFRRSVMNEYAEKPDPAFVLDPKRLAGMTEDEQDYMNESVNQKHSEMIAFDIENRREDMATINRSGAGVGIAASLVAGVPEGLLSGLGAAKAFQLAKVGSAAYAAQGARGSAALSNLAENAVGNVALLAAQEKLDPYVNASDYAMALGFSVAGTGLSLRGIHTAASGAELKTLGDKLMAESAARTQAVREQAVANVGEDAPADVLQAEMRRLEANQIKQETSAATSALPEDRRLLPEDEAIREDAPEAAANEMDVGLELFHGTKADVKASGLNQSADLGPHFTTARETAEQFANDGGTRGNVLEAVGKFEKPLDVEDLGSWFPVDVAGEVDSRLGTSFKDATWEAMEAARIKFLEDNPEATGAQAVKASNDAGFDFIKKAIKGEGYDSLRYKNTYEGKPVDTYIALDMGKVKDKGGKKINTPEEAKIAFNDAVAEDWQSGSYQAKRQLLAETSEQWRKDARTVTDGEFDFQSTKDLPTGLTVTSKFKEQPHMAALVDAYRGLLAEYAPGQKIVLGTGTLKDGSNGVAVSVGNVHLVGIDPKLSSSEQLHTALHEFGHTVYHAHAQDAPAAILDRINKEWLDFVNRAKAGDSTAVDSRFAITSPNAKAEKLPLSSYAASRDEYMAEQFVKHLQQRLVSGEAGKLPPRVVQRIMGAVRAVIDFFKGAKKAGLVKPDSGADEFFSAVFNGTLKKTSKVEEEFLSPGLVVPGTEHNLLLDSDGQLVASTKDGRRVLVDKEEMGGGGVTLRAYVDGKEVGSLYYSEVKRPDGGFFHPDVVVNPDQQRKGIASLLYNVAEANGGLISPVNAKGVFRSPEGQAFREARASAPSFGSEARAVPPDAITNDPVAIKNGLHLLPVDNPAQQAEVKAITALYKKADGGYKVDEKRLSKLLDTAVFKGAQSTANTMLRSKNPVVRMVAAELLESASGAGGRRSTAAIAKHMNEQAYLGNTLNDFQNSYKVFRNSQGGNVAGDFFDGKLWEQFNRNVADEIESRRPGGTPVVSHPAVKQAADQLEQGYERMRVAQTTTKTIGWASLPESSKGYMPHKMSPEKVRNMTNKQAEALHSALTDQFVGIEGFDLSFADKLASKYLDRIQRRALGGFEAPAGIHQTGAADVVEEALEQMGMDRMQITAMMKRYMAGGAGHTKRRLKLDLNAEHADGEGGTFKLMDLFETDQFKLLRSQAQRVSGEVALARHGVMGKSGLNLLRRAMEFGADGQKAQPEEIKAFDQVAAEFLGAPFGTQNKFVDRVMQVNSLARLGGMGFTQFAEAINGVFHVGAAKSLDAVSSMGRLRSEIKALARGEKVDNPIIGSLEKFSGAEFGTEAYKTVFPFDNGSLEYQTYGKDTVTAADRLLRGGAYAQGKLSLWRTLHSTQQRGFAEQIVRKAAQFLQDGTNDTALRDMGMSDELLAKLRKDLPNIAEFQGNKLTNFDITKATDMAAADEFVQSVHRGVSQIIQGTFIGEKGAWAHDGIMRVMTQFRTFSLTSIEKQWARQVGNVGTAKAMGMMLGAMSLAAPIYMARTYLASVGRPDQEEYLEKQLAPAQIARATLNYIAMSGLSGDMLDAMTAVTGMGTATGGRTASSSNFVGNVVAPAAGTVDDIWKALQNTKEGTDPHDLLKTLPFSRLPYMIPAINALDE